MIFISDTSEKRVDVFLAEKSGLTRSYISNLISEGRLTVGGKTVKVSYKVKCGDEIELDIPELREPEIIKQNIPLDIVFEDSEIIVINKPQGMVVHPAAGNYEGTLVNALMAHCGDSLSGINGVARPGIVHRIDKDTSGLLVVAKTNEAHLSLAEQIKVHSCKREYLALARGRFKVPTGTVNAPIGRNPKDRKKMCAISGGRPAVTHYEVLEEFGEYTLVRCRLETGRTHQIRVHLSHIGHPLACDPVYGIKKEKLKAEGQLLHAETLEFTHPKTGENMRHSCEIPQYFKEILEKLRRECK